MRKNFLVMGTIKIIITIIIKIRKTPKHDVNYDKFIKKCITKPREEDLAAIWIYVSLKVY